MSGPDEFDPKKLDGMFKNQEPSQTSVFICRPARRETISQDAAHRLQELVAEKSRRIAELEAAQYVPGLYRCAKCFFVLLSKKLYVKSGTVGPNEKSDDCPNGCGPLWRVTWKERAEQLRQTCEDLHAASVSHSQPGRAE